jgi:hypothetical protein
VTDPASPDNVHCAKSIGFPQSLQVCGFSNSSEKISFSLPHAGHLQVKDFRFLNDAYPGQCWGVDMISSYTVNCLFFLQFHGRNLEPFEYRRPLRWF